MTDRFNLACPACGKEVEVARIHIGKKGRCSACQSVFPIQEPVVAEIMPSREATLESLAQPWPAAPHAQSMASYELASQPMARGAIPSPFGAPAPAQSPFGNDGGYALSQNNGFPLAQPSLAAGAEHSVAHGAMSKAYESPNYTNTAPARSGEGSGSILAGLAMMIGAVVWFVVGLWAGRIFFYPPFLFVFGLIAFVKGLVNAFSPA